MDENTFIDHRYIPDKPNSGDPTPFDWGKFYRRWDRCSQPNFCPNCGRELAHHHNYPRDLVFTGEIGL